MIDFKKAITNDMMRGDLMWVNAQGERIAVKDMSDGYLRNCLNMLRRLAQRPIVVDWEEVFQSELYFRSISISENPIPAEVDEFLDELRRAE
jgi:hypothetical protein